MVEEAASDGSVTMPEKFEVSENEEKCEKTLNPNDEVKTKASIEACIESFVQGGTNSTCNNNNPEISSLTAESEGEKSLEYAGELMDNGTKAMKEDDYSEAADCFSRALEIKVSHYGELAPECVQTYYKYGCALLYKSQEEADPFAYVPKAESESQQSSHKDHAAKSALNGESSTASVSSNVKQDESSNRQEPALDEGSTGNNQEEEDGDSDDEGVTELDEDESDLDLAWKMLDVARAIVEKHSGNTKEQVDILSALAEVALEREDIETSLSDYQKALSILEQLVEPDSRDIAYINFRICLCLEVGAKTQEAIPYCQRAMSICKTRMCRLKDELKGISKSGASGALEAGQGVEQSSGAPQSDDLATSRQAEIETLTSLLNDLEKKLEDLQLLSSNPRSVLTEILARSTSKAGVNEKTSSSAVNNSSQMATATGNGDFDSPTASTAHTNASAGVTHLGVVGRGVKRVIVNSSTAESNASKKPSLESSDKGDGGAA